MMLTLQHRIKLSSAVHSTVRVGNHFGGKMIQNRMKSLQIACLCHERIWQNVVLIDYMV